MTMDNEDRFISSNERDASPERFGGKDAAAPRDGRLEQVETRGSASSVSSVSTREPTSRSRQQSLAMNRAETQTDNLTGLERNATAMSRIETQRTQHSHTIGATVTSRKSKKPVPKMGGEKPYPPPLPDREEYVVEFDGEHDPMHAQNWPMKKKLMVGVMLGYTTFVAAFGSSIFSAATRTVAKVFGVSAEVGTLGVSLYVLGFATGKPTLSAHKLKRPFD